jgi:hypothetical protein
LIYLIDNKINDNTARLKQTLYRLVFNFLLNYSSPFCICVDKKYLLCIKYVFELYYYYEIDFLPSMLFINAVFLLFIPFFRQFDCFVWKLSNENKTLKVLLML